LPMTHDFDAYPFEREHCLSISDFHRIDIERLLELGAHYLNLDEQKGGNRKVLRGKTLINLFFENSTRTEKSFELAGKRLGADVISMQVASSSVKKGETLLDTAATLNAMNPDLLVVRHGSSGAPALLAQKVSCSVQLLNLLGANVRLIGPPTLIPTDADRWGVEVFHDMETGLKGCDVVMMLRLQLERMKGAFVPSKREYYHFHGLTRAKLAHAKPDDPDISLITHQVGAGVAMRMAILHALSDAQNGRQAKAGGQS